MNISLWTIKQNNSSETGVDIEQFDFTETDDRILQELEEEETIDDDGDLEQIGRIYLSNLPDAEDICIFNQTQLKEIANYVNDLNL